MKTLIKWILCFSLILTSGTLLQAQDSRDSSLWVVETTDDNEYVGEILYRDDKIVTLKTKKIGEITIQMKEIKSIKKVAASQMVDGEFWFENPHATRYFWGPNGYGLKQGEGYYQNTWIIFNQVSYGVTDNFSIGLGTLPFFLFGGVGGSTPIWITPKVSIPIQKDQFNIGVGALIGGVPGEGGGLAGIAYGTATLGTRDNNVSFSLGYGFIEDNWADAPTITFSGMYRTGKRWYIVTENYFIRVDGQTLALVSLGGRSVFKKIALDFGGFVPVAEGIGGVYIFPWLGINIPFGNKKLGE